VEIHKPKPVHNWREFLTELGTIVLGICIALAGEQTIEELRWKSQVQEARAAIAGEMAQNIGTAFVMARNRICAERRLDEVAQILDRAAETGVLPPLGQIGRPAPRLWRYGTWDSMVASQVVTHFPRDQLAALANIYTAVRRADDNAEREAWTDLNAISGPGRRLDPASETELRRALGRARITTQAKADLSALILDQAQKQHLPFTPQDLNLIAALRSAAQNGDKTDVPAALAKLLPGGFRICRPIGPAPAHYGQALPDMGLSLGDDRQNALPDFGAP
jgi:hypothetical protein